MGWTEHQLLAINGRGRRVLVSAAAGAGKTAVLVERVIRRITEGDAPENISDFLIVTYTNAAAAEMRSRIAAAVGERLAQNPGSAHLRRQMSLIHSARIMTVHAFCLRLIRENFHLAGVSPEFRVAGTEEDNSLRAAAIEALLEEKYKEGDPDFFELVERVSGARDDARLREMILACWDFSQNDPDPGAFLAGLGDEGGLSGSNPADTPWGRAYFSGLLPEIAFHENAAAESLALLGAHPEIEEKYAPALKADSERLRALRECCAAGDWEGARACLEGSHARLSAARGGDERVKELIKARRQAAKDFLGGQKGLSRGVLARSAPEAMEDMRATLNLGRALGDCAAGFGRIYAGLKKDAGLLTFSDIEHIAFGLLAKKSGDGGYSPTDAALRLAEGVGELMVDEYQDTNGLQDEIFKCINAAGADMFMVGDMKQSIYSFRRAEPERFYKMRESYPEARPRGAGEDGAFEFETEEALVLLRNNFRSRPGILNAVNYVFGRIMRREFGGIDYSSGEALFPPPDSGADEEICAELDIVGLCAPRNENAAEPSGEPEERSDEPEGEDSPGELGSKEAEAAHIAARIARILRSGMKIFDKELGAERPVRPGDIAVLTRTMKNRGGVLAAALSDAGIPSCSEAGSGFFGAAEINAMLALLSAADNPRNDVALLGCMRSALTGFSEDELARIRLFSGGGPFYDALRAAALSETELGAKCAGFLSALDEARLSLAEYSISGAVSALSEMSGALAVYGGGDGGELARTNLLLLFELAGEFEKRGGAGLGDFIRFLEDAREAGSVSGPGAERGGLGGVRIMSIHRSKGLEFPIVFLAFSGTRLNMTWQSDAMLIHPELGPGFFRRNLDLGVEYTTLRREGIVSKTLEKQLSEELRGLYVAMTRARERLIIVAAHKNPERELEKLGVPASPELAAAVCRRVRSLAAFAEAALCMDGALEPGTRGPFKINFCAAPAQVSARAAESAAQEPDAGLVAEICRRITRIYPYEAETGLAAKLTATAYKGIVDTTENSEYFPPVRAGASLYKKPRFLDAGGRRLRAAEQGVAYHLAMQLLPLRAYSGEEDVGGELELLREKGILSRLEFEAVEPSVLLRFFQSGLWEKLLTLPEKSVMREFKFSILRPAAEFFPEMGLHGGEKLLLQGVIDLWYEEGGAVHLVDYKSDGIDADEARQRAEGYAPQLKVYAGALAGITGLEVKSAGIFFIRPGVFCPVGL